MGASVGSRGRWNGWWLALPVLLMAAPAAAQAPLLPSAMAYDAAGNLYFTDANRNQVFEVALSGVVSVVAGDGKQGFAGDGGAAASAELNTPLGIAVGPDGTLFLADSGNNRIRSVANGVISTVAGDGQRGFGGDAGVATSAVLNGPTAITVGAGGGVLFCDTGNHRVRRISNGVISTVAGNGTQGFGGDGLQAVGAELDSPEGIAVAADGSFSVADTHNNRVRAVSVSGVIGTIAGTGSAGNAGDGGPATAAQMSRPMGLVNDAAGNLYVAEANSQRIRMIAVSGTISTVAGSGAQGYSQDGVVATAGRMNLPRGVGVSPFGMIGFTDTQNGAVRVIALGGKLVTVAPAAAGRVSQVSLVVAPVVTYGQGVAGVSVLGIGSPAGTVSLQDGATSTSATGLVGGAASFSLAALDAGGHQLIAAYGGDGVNPAAVSAGSPVSVQPAAVVATAGSQTIEYGQSIPALNGTTSGILAQDAGRITVSFLTTAVALSPVGSYPITAVLTGAASANYALTIGANSGALQIAKAQSTVVMQGVAAQSYAGLPIVLAAYVGSTTSGVPTGVVDFNDNGVMVASIVAVNGLAAGSYTPVGIGAHTITAAYRGDGNFLADSSTPAVTATAAMPDFTLGASSPNQTVQGGLVATFPLMLSAVGGPFTGAVSFSVKGLPAGAVASFAPTTVVPGAGNVSVTMNVQTVALAELEHADGRTGVMVAFLLPLGLMPLARRRGIRGFAFVVVIGVLGFGVGCGARTLSGAVAASQTSQLTITATSTNLAGAAVVHTVGASLTVH